MDHLLETPTGGSRVIGMYVGNSSDNELFAEYLDDIRIYGVRLSPLEINNVYGSGFGDQFPSVLITEKSARDSNPRHINALIGKDGLPVALTGLTDSDWSLQAGGVFDMSVTGDGNYSLSLDLNDSLMVSVLSIDGNASVDADGKPSEPFSGEVFLHDLVYDEAHLVSRWSFDEANVNVIRDLGFGVNDGFLVGDSILTPGKFGNALTMDGTGDYMRVPMFAGIHQESNFTISAWVFPTNLGYTSDVQDAAIFGADGNNADTVLVWYNVNGDSTANRSFSFNIGATSIGLNRLNAPDGLALQDRWQHVVAVMSGQGRKIYHNGLLVAESTGSDNIVTIEGNHLTIGGWDGSGNMDFEGSLDEVRFYNRSFTDTDVSILYGHGNGDVGLTPVISLESNSTASLSTGRVNEFLRFGQPQVVLGFSDSDFEVFGGTISNLELNGSAYNFDFSANSYPGKLNIGLDEGIVEHDGLKSRAVLQSFVKSAKITAQDSLVLWYPFNELNNSMTVHDFSGNEVDGSLNSGRLIPGKFSSALHLKPGEQLEVNSELLSLTSAFTLSLWAKVLDDGFGVLARNGQFSLEYHEDNTIRGYAITNNGSGETKARLPSGRWVHYVVSYDGDTVRMFLDGQLVSETSHNGYLAWGDGADHKLYLNRYTTDDDWKANAVYDDFRIYNRALSDSEIGILWSMSAGDLGLSPLITGTDPFYKVPSLTRFLLLKIIKPFLFQVCCKVTSMFQMPRSRTLIPAITSSI